MRTIVRGGPVKATAAGEVRFFKVIRGKKGKVSIRTYGYPNLKFQITQKAPATTDYKRFTRTATAPNSRREFVREGCTRSGVAGRQDMASDVGLSIQP